MGRRQPLQVGLENLFQLFHALPIGVVPKRPFLPDSRDRGALVLVAQIVLDLLDEIVGTSIRDDLLAVLEQLA
jgi:hypothetical protein